MYLCQGGTLWSEVEALREKGTFMPEQRILLILHGICSGLQAIHSKGYAHRWGPWPGVGAAGF